MSDKKIHTVADGKIVYLRRVEDHLVPATVPLGDLDLIPSNLIQQVGPQSYHLALRDDGAWYLTKPTAEGPVQVSREAGNAASFTREDHVWRVGEYALTLTPVKVAWVRWNVSSPAAGSTTREDFPRGPLMGNLHVVRAGVRYDLHFLKTDRPALERDMADRPSILLGGDGFRDRRGVEVFLGTVTWDRVLTRHGEAARLESLLASEPEAAVPLVETWRNDRVAFSTPDGHRLCVREERGAYVLGFAADAEAEYFHFSPSPLVETLHFWLVNRATRKYLTAGEHNHSDEVSCQSVKDHSISQIWTFSPTGLSNSDGRQLRLLERAGAEPSLTLHAGGREVQFYLNQGCLHHVGRRLLVEAESDKAAVADQTDDIAKHQHWDLIPYSPTPRYGTDRFSSFEGVCAFSITDKISSSPRVWTLQEDGSIGLEERKSPQSLDQTWIYNRGYITDSFRRHLLVFCQKKLVCREVPACLVPEEYVGARWGMTSDGCIVPRQGGNWVLTSSLGRVNMAPFLPTARKYQHWHIIPHLDHPFSVVAVAPIAKVVVELSREELSRTVEQVRKKKDAALVSFEKLYKAGKLREATNLKLMIEASMPSYSVEELAEQRRGNPRLGLALAATEGDNVLIVYPTEKQKSVIAVVNVNTLRLSLFLRPLKMRDSELADTPVFLSGSTGKSRQLVSLFLDGQPWLTALTGVSRQNGRPPDVTIPTAQSLTGSDTSLVLEQGACTPVPVQHLPEALGHWLFVAGKDKLRLFQTDGLGAVPFREISDARVSLGIWTFQNPGSASGAGRLEGKPFSSCYAGDKVYRLIVKGQKLEWDAFDLASGGSEGWSPVKSLTLPVMVPVPGTSAVGIALRDGIVHIAVSCVRDGIWLCEWNPGADSFRRLRLLTDCPRPSEAHPALTFVNDQLIVAYVSYDLHPQLLKLKI